jgi:phosphomannomutase
MTILPAIFKAYDVRALYPSELDEQAAYLIGRAYVAYLESTRPAGVAAGVRRGDDDPLRIAVSRDMRLSSPSLSGSFVDGAREQGANIVDFGLASTDMMYFAVAREGFDGGVQVTEGIQRHEDGATRRGAAVG